MTHLVLLTLASGVTPEEQRILKLAHWMGVPTRTISIDEGSALGWQIPAEGGGQKDCVAMSAETLALMHAASADRLERLVQERWAKLLIFGCSQPTRYKSALAWLTGGAIRGVSAPVPGQNVVEFPVGGRELSRQLAGLSFSTEHGLAVPTFDCAVDSGSAEAIMLVNRQAVMIRMTTASSEIFVLGGSETPDIDERLSREKGIETYYDRLAPLLIFLRHSFGKTCWHSPGSTARLIIDDPLLTKRYGFLDYRALLSSMHRERFGASIAFIPWNYRRTSVRTASSLFGERPDFSICVHGCDHTNKEFDGTDQALLEWKAGLALERMESHQTRTGLPFERVMVFPQGKFSTDAIGAVRASGYLAAVNSTCFPTDAGPDSLTIADFLRPAITRFHGFPIFQRRYPKRLVDSAFDMFLGKPALLVEHVQYFRDGGEELEKFVAGLRSLEPALAWPTLSSQLARSCIMRFAARDTVEVQFFTKRFRVENPGHERRRFRLARYEPDPAAVREVLVDGIGVPFSVENDFVGFELEADPGQARSIVILDHPRPPRGVRRMGLGYNLGVYARRRLSEFRDLRLVRHPRLLQAATGLARELRLTGDRNGKA